MTKRNVNEIIAQYLDSENWVEIERYFNSSEFIKHMGIRVVLEDPEQPMVEICDVKPFHLGGVGGEFVNGAIISAVFDLAIGLTGIRYSPLGKFATSNINIQLLRPVENSRLYAISKCNKKIGSKVFSESTLFNYRDEPCAYATGEIRVGLK